MVGFGFMDQTVMLHAGNLIDMTLGVTFGLSTLTAAAAGQVCSDMAGVTFGGVIGKMAARLGLPEADFSAEQRARKEVNRTGLAGSLCGVFCGCSLGMLNLFFIDTHEVQELKLAAISTEQGFNVEFDNTKREDCTLLALTGPANIGGVIAAVCTAVASNGCMIMNMTGYRMLDSDANADMGTCICGNVFHEDSVFCRKCGMIRPTADSAKADQLKFTFYIMKDGKQVKDEDLVALQRSVMAACNHPERFRNLLGENQAMREEIRALREQRAATGVEKPAE